QLEILEMLRKHKAVKAATAIQPVDRRNHTQRTDSIELTPNGTMNSKALPFPDSYLTRAYEPPQDGIGKALAIIWRELLKLDQVGCYVNFFSLGGDSLMAIRVVMRLRQHLNVDVAIGDVFLHPVLTDLALLLRSAARVELPAITPVERSGPFPLSFAQQRLFFMAQMKGATKIYHIPFGLRLRGELDYGALRRALN